MIVFFFVVCIVEYKVNVGMFFLVEVVNEWVILFFEFLFSWFCYVFVVV